MQRPTTIDLSDDLYRMLLDHPNDLRVLLFVAIRQAKHGQAFLGDYDLLGLTRQQFRTCLSHLENAKMISISSHQKGLISTINTACSIFDNIETTTQPTQQPTKRTRKLHDHQAIAELLEVTTNQLNNQQVTTISYSPAKGGIYDASSQSAALPVKESDSASASEAKLDPIAAKFPELGFTNFWKSYPKKRGSKPKAFVKWRNLKEADRRVILDGLPRLLATVSEVQYLKAPEVFLNSFLWLSEDWLAPYRHPQRGNAAAPATYARSLSTFNSGEKF